MGNAPAFVAHVANVVSHLSQEMAGITISCVRTDAVMYGARNSIPPLKMILMIGKIINYLKVTGAHPHYWLVVWDVLAYVDYQEIIVPWCKENFEDNFIFLASSSVGCLNEEDALLLYMRFK